MNLFTGMSNKTDKLQERTLIRVALELRAENYRENTQSIFDALRPLTNAIERKLKANDVRWEDVAVEGDYLQLIALIPESESSAQKVLLKVNLDLLEIKDPLELQQLIDSMPHFTDEPEYTALSYDAEEIRLINLMTLAGYDTHDLSLTKDQMRQILNANIASQRKH